MIVFLLPGKDPFESSGGYATYGRNLAKCLKGLGYEVHIVLVSDRGGIENTEVGCVHRIPTKLRLPETIASPFFGLQIKRYIHGYVEKKEVPELIVHGVGLWALAGALLKRRYGRRVHTVASYFTTALNEIYWLARGISVRDHGLWLKAKYTLVYAVSLLTLKLVEAFLLKGTDKIIVHYNSTRKILTEEYCVDAEKIVKTAYYTETYAKKTPEAKTVSRELLKKKPLCSVVCRQTSRKGVNHVIRALARIPAEKRPYTLIVGTGDLLEKHKKLASKLGLGDRVVFTGYVEDVAPILEKADVFVQASLQEGSGSLSVLEAMKLGVPIVSTACDGIPEDIEHRRTGLLVPPGDTTALAEAIEEILNDNQLSQFLRKNARQEYRERFNKEKMKKELERVYSWLCA